MKHDDQDTRRWGRIVRAWKRDLRAWLAESDAGTKGVDPLDDHPLKDIVAREHRLLLAAGSTACAIDVFA